MSEVKTMPDCWVVVDGGQIIGTNDAPGHVNGIDAVRYVPATEVEATKNSAAIWHSRYTEVCQDRIALRQKYGHEIEALEQEVEALKADAERYRHLRSQFRTEWLHNGVDYGRGREIVSSYARAGVELPRTFARIGHSNSYKVSAETIDQAIDAEIDAARKEK